MSEVQRTYRRYQQKGWPGSLARPVEPHAFHPGIIHVPANARKPRPGDALFWNRAQNRFAIPTTAAELNQACGILSYDTGTVQQAADAPPAGANSEHFVEYKDGDRIKVGVMGTFFVEAGEACEYDDLMAWDIATFKWDVRPQVEVAASADVAALLANVNAAFQNLRRLPFKCVDRAPVAVGELLELQVGYGRVH